MAQITSPQNILEIYFLPPQAIARLGGSATPLERYVWNEDPTIAGAARNVIEPDVTLDVDDDGSVMPYRTAHLRFKDNGLFRPVAPFFELWAEIRTGAGVEQVPLTGALLATYGASSANLRFTATAANLKAARRCGDEGCGFGDSVTVAGDDHVRHALRGASPRQAGSTPLVLPDKPIPLGSFQVMRPKPWKRASIDADIIRVRFTPAKGEVYGPPSAITGVSPGVLRTHMIVRPENRILNPEAAWVRYDANDNNFANPQPADTYDGADINDQRSWGVVDDTCDVVIVADLVIGGIRRQATVRAFVGPPDFAPDRRPFISLADELTDRDQPSTPADESLENLELRINDLFLRVLETASLMGLDAARNRFLSQYVPDNADSTSPRLDLNSMTAKDQPYAQLSAVFPDWIALARASTEGNRLPLSNLIPEAHRTLADLNAMVTRLREQAERVRMLVRPPFARWEELPATVVDADPAGTTYRDPRSPNVGRHSMRMPPFMRDSDALPLSITHRQYTDLMRLLDELAKQVAQASAVLESRGKRLAVATGASQASVAQVPPALLDTPIRRVVHQHAARVQLLRAAAGPHQSMPALLSVRALASSPKTSIADVAAQDHQHRVFPLNLTARAAKPIDGNPDGTRLESGVGNCFPGLEFDHRNLERRFFPGLVVEYVQIDSPEVKVQQRLQGCRVVAVDAGDPDLQQPSFLSATSQGSARRSEINRLADALNDLDSRLDRGEVWFVSAITQKDKRIVLSSLDAQGQGIPLAGMTIWRMVRSLEPGPVTVELVAREMPGNQPLPDAPIKLMGWRRRYTDATTGVISAAYRPGELTQSLCSPWTHDFRDCGCVYWASNHPDVVRLEPKDDLLPSGISSDPASSLLRVDWLRSDRAAERSQEAYQSGGLNRPIQMDHYEINQRWQELSVVLEDAEIGNIYAPRVVDRAEPFKTLDELATTVFYLASLEHVLAVEYLYALYSIRDASEITGNDPAAQELRMEVQFMRDVVQLVAVNEMQHLRYANQLLWELVEKFPRELPRSKFPPSLDPAATIPNSAAGKPRARMLRSLSLDTMRDFIAVERPSATIEGQYARVVATLQQIKQLDSLYQLASRIIEEGNEHFIRFSQIEAIMLLYPDSTPWLRPIRPALPSDAKVRRSLALYRQIIGNLRTAYATGSVTDRDAIAIARSLMFELDKQCETLAGGSGLGVPLFSIFP